MTDDASSAIMVLRGKAKALLKAKVDYPRANSFQQRCLQEAKTLSVSIRREEGKARSYYTLHSSYSHIRALPGVSEKPEASSPTCIFNFLVSAKKGRRPFSSVGVANAVGGDKARGGAEAACAAVSSAVTFHDSRPCNQSLANSGGQHERASGR